MDVIRETRSEFNPVHLTLGMFMTVFTVKLKLIAQAFICFITELSLHLGQASLCII